MANCDVVVLGGGPAGLAVAVALTRLGRSVVVMERTRYDRPRPGETFGGELGPLLRNVGAWDDFLALEPVPFRGVQSAWGGESLLDRPSIFHPFGEGWHVDRARFDDMLAKSAERQGVVVRRGVGVCTPTWRGEAWDVSPPAGESVTASYLVDASGRGAPATAVHIPGRRWLRADRLVALVGKFTGTRPIEPVLVLEAAEEGWWYSVPQPDGALLAVLVTDADLLPARGRTALGHHFLAGVSRAPHTAERAAGGELASAPWIARSESGTLLPGRGRAWCALGDAAIGCDPLAGDGVTRALKAAFDAAPEIDRELAGDETAAAAANERLRERFGDYLDLRARYYEHEPRWRDALFWARRRSVDWREAPLLLDPRHLLRWNGTVPSREALAPVEALIPYGALRKLFEQKQPTGAHEALAQLRAAAPVGDRRLLVGLQLAAALGCVAVES